MNIPHTTQTSGKEKKEDEKGVMYYNALKIFTGNMHL